jgi:hypothetical protein
MIHDHPNLHQPIKLLCFADQFICLRHCRDRGALVIDCVSFSPAELKVVGEEPSLRTQNESGRLKCNRMMASPRTYTIARARDGDRSGLESGVVGGGKSSVRGECLNRSVGQVTGNQGSNVVELLFAGLVRFDFTLRQ